MYIENPIFLSSKIRLFKTNKPHRFLQPVRFSSFSAFKIPNFSFPSRSISLFEIPAGISKKLFSHPLLSLKRAILSPYHFAE